MPSNLAQAEQLFPFPLLLVHIFQFVIKCEHSIKLVRDFAESNLSIGRRVSRCRLLTRWGDVAIWLPSRMSIDAFARSVVSISRVTTSSHTCELGHMCGPVKLTEPSTSCLADAMASTSRCYHQTTTNPTCTY